MLDPRVCVVHRVGKKNVYANLFFLSVGHTIKGALCVAPSSHRRMHIIICGICQALSENRFIMK